MFLEVDLIFKSEVSMNTESSSVILFFPNFTDLKIKFYKTRSLVFLVSET